MNTHESEDMTQVDCTKSSTGLYTRNDTDIILMCVRELISLVLPCLPTAIQRLYMPIHTTNNKIIILGGGRMRHISCTPIY